MKRACIFDLDGTLANTLESIAYCANRAIATVGLGPNPVENYKQYAGDGAPEMLRRSLRAAGDKKLEYFERVQKEYAAIFAKDCMYHVEPYAGIREALAALKERGVYLAVLSNKPHARTVDVIETLFGAGYFDDVQGMIDEASRKPSPVGALAIAERAKAAPGDCLYVGDTNTDMQTGKAAGMYTVGVSWGFRERSELTAHGADVVIDEPLQLLQLIDIKNNQGEYRNEETI